VHLLGHTYNGIESAEEIESEIVGGASGALVLMMTGKLN